MACSFFVPQFVQFMVVVTTLEKRKSVGTKLQILAVQIKYSTVETTVNMAT